MEQSFAAVEGIAGWGVVGDNPEGGTEAATGLGNVAFLEVTHGQALPRAVMVGIEGKRFAGIGHAFFNVAHFPVDGSTTIPSFGKLREIADEVVQHTKGFREVVGACRLEGGVQEFVCFGAGGIKPEVLQGTPAEIANSGIFGVESEQELLLSAQPGESAGGHELLVIIAGDEFVVETILIPGGMLKGREEQQQREGRNHKCVEKTRHTVRLYNQSPKYG